MTEKITSPPRELFATERNEVLKLPRADSEELSMIPDTPSVEEDMNSSGFLLNQTKTCAENDAHFSDDHTQQLSDDDSDSEEDLQCDHHHHDREEYSGAGGMCVRGRGKGVKASLKLTLARRAPIYLPDSEDPMFVQELLKAGMPQHPDAITHPAEAEVNGLYQIGDWSVCLMEKEARGALRLKSVEQHFELGHLQFTITPEMLATGILGPDEIFGTEDEALDYLEHEADEDGEELLCPHHHHHQEAGHSRDRTGGGHGRRSEDGGSETVDVEYWDELFTEQAGTTSEWLVSYHSLKRHLAPYLKCSDDMLVVGCGNSDLSLGLYDDGFQSITSMDISGVVIEEMRSKFSHCEGMKWDVQDVLDMTYDDSSFDVVVDKSLMDCIFHCGNSEPLVANMLGELHRVLRKGSGVAVFLTTQQPEIVLPLLEDSCNGCWETEVDFLTVETDKDGNVPRCAQSVLGRDEVLHAAHSKRFTFLVCSALVDHSFEDSHNSGKRRC